jgi:hypothetical protein
MLKLQEPPWWERASKRKRHEKIAKRAEKRRRQEEIERRERLAIKEEARERERQRRLEEKKARRAAEKMARRTEAEKSGQSSVVSKTGGRSFGANPPPPPPPPQTSTSYSNGGTQSLQSKKGTQSSIPNWRSQSAVTSGPNSELAAKMAARLAKNGET